MARKRRTYTPEFKAEAVKLVTDKGYSVAEAAQIGVPLMVHAPDSPAARAIRNLVRSLAALPPPARAGWWRDAPARVQGDVR